MLLEINPLHPEPRKIRRAVDELEAGRVIAYPTDTAYGLGCDIFNKKAVDSLYQIKQLPKSKRLSFICPDIREAARYAIIHDWVYRILKGYLPGPYCFILEATREVPKVVQSPRKTVGVRIPSNPVALALVQELGRPIISTTASNAEAGEVDPDPREVDTLFPGVSLILDAGPGGTDRATVVDLTGSAPVVLRIGTGDPSPFQ